MKRVLTLVMALGVAALFSNAALAGADCSYHKTQAAVDKPDAGQVQTAQAEPTKPAPATETKK